MKALGKLLSSAAKTEILRALHHQQEAVGLRQLSRIAAVGVRSAELALDSLVEAKLVQRTRTPTRVLYAMNANHPSASVLSDAFDAATLASIREDCRLLDKRASRILPFIEEARRMLAYARGANHVT